jgi:hypothetical protein
VARFAKWVALALADGICAFGEGPLHVLFWIGFITGAFGIGVWLAGGVSSGHLTDALLYSLGSMSAGSFSNVRAVNHTIEAWAAVERILGIAGIGLFGFVLGNRIRQS